MNQWRSLSIGGWVTVGALLAAAVGIVIQPAAGVDLPPIPPGLIVLGSAAAIVAFLPW